MHHGDGVIDRDVAREAAQWLSLLFSGEATAQDEADCLRWRQADPRHEQAWSKAEAVRQKLGLMPKPVAHATLGRPRLQRRDALKALAVMAAAGGLGYQVTEREWWRHLEPGYLTAGHGEQRQLRLPNGIQVHLNTNSRAVLEKHGASPTLRLLAGELVIETKTGGGEQAFVLATPQGTIRPQSACRLHVRAMDSQHCRLNMLTGTATLAPGQSSSVISADPGVRYDYNANGLLQQAPVQPYADAWTRGVLVADNLRLDEFVAELQRYRRGYVRLAPGIAHLRISGAFQLARLDHTLTALPQTLPVQVRQLTGLLTFIDAA